MNAKQRKLDAEDLKLIGATVDSLKYRMHSVINDETTSNKAIEAIAGWIAIYPDVIGNHSESIIKQLAYE